MSWNTAFIAINKDFSDKIRELQTDLGINFGEAVETISWEDATSSMISGTSIGFGDGWTIICDPAAFFENADFEPPNPNEIWIPKIERGLEKCSVGVKALGFILAGVSSTYGLSVYVDGICVRRRLVQEGEVLIDFGTPSPLEVKVFEEEFDEEQRVFKLLDNFGLTYEILDAAKFTLYKRSVNLF